MKKAKQHLQISLIEFKDVCKSAGQSGLINCGISQEIRETQSDEVVFWIMYDLIDRLETKDFNQLKVFADICSKKIADQLDNFTNTQTDHEKASLMSRIDFYKPNNELQKIS
jgi:hypothetical protein